jgi:hypothetical protein
MAGSIAGTTITHRSRGLVQLKAVFTTDASGDASATVIGEAYGRIVGVTYDPVTGGVATGADFTLTDADTGATLFSLTNAGTSALFKRPTCVATDNAGVALTAAATAVDVNRDIYVAGKLKLLVAQGGVSKTGTFRVFVEE